MFGLKVKCFRSEHMTNTLQRFPWAKVPWPSALLEGANDSIRRLGRGSRALEVPIRQERHLGFALRMEATNTRTSPHWKSEV